MTLSFKIITTTETELLAQCAILHKAVYPSYLFTSRLSRSLLTKYYKEMVKEAEFSFCILHNSKVVGVVLGGYGRLKFVSDFNKNNFFHLLLTLISNPDMLVRIVPRVWKSLFKSNHIYQDKVNSKEGRLYNILVCESVRGKGIAGQLVYELQNALISSGAKSVTLTVDSKNFRAINFYEKLDFNIVGAIGNSIEMSRNFDETV